MSTRIDKFTNIFGSGKHFRDYQQDCYERLHEARERDEKSCLCLMFCGTGKTRIFYSFMLDFNFSIAVFPTLALADQFISDYAKNELLNCKQFRFDYLRISSDNDCEKEKKTTTDPEKIRKFLQKKRKIVLVTYASLGLLFACMEQVRVVADTIVYDEAHNVVGEKCQARVFDKESPVLFKTFFTATYRNANGIVMFKVGDEQRPSDCGPCIFRYTLPQALERDDPVCQDFDFCTFLSHCKNADSETPDDKVARNLRMIADVIVTNDCRRVIINHAFSEAENDTRTSVDSFATEVRRKFLISEIKKLDNENKYKKIIYNGVGAKNKERADIINAFNNDTPDEVHIISQCKIFSEGIDTKLADMTVFMDEKGSSHVIIQIIGRVTRKKANNKKGIVLIPIVVDIDVLNDAKTPEERDKVIRDYMNAERNFNPILNVMTALREEDPEYYEMCLRYPFSFSPAEIENKIAKSGRKLEESKGNLKQNVEYLVGETLELDDKEEDLEVVAKTVKKPIRVVTLSMDQGKTFENYGKEFTGEETLQLFHNEKGEYQPIVKIEKTERKRDIEKPKREPFANKFKVQSDSEVKILWDISDIASTLTGGMLASLSSEMLYDLEENRIERIQQYYDKWYLKNGKTHARTFPWKINRLSAEEHVQHKWGQWRCTMRGADKGVNNSVLTPKQRELILALMPDFFDESISDDDRLKQVKKYIDWYETHNRTHPKRNKKDMEETGLANWKHRIRMANNGKNNCRLTQEMKDKLIKHIPDFFESETNTDEDRMETVYRYIEWYIAHENIHPKRNTKAKTDEEKEENYLAGWRQNMKRANKGQNVEAVLTDIMKEELEDSIPDFFQEEITSDLDRDEKVENYIKWYKLHGRHPTMNDDECLCTWRRTVKQGIRIISGIQKQRLLDETSDFFENDAVNDNDRIEKAKNYVEWYKANKKLHAREFKKIKKEDRNKQQMLEHSWYIWRRTMNTNNKRNKKPQIVIDYLKEKIPDFFYNKVEATEDTKSPEKIKCQEIITIRSRKGQICGLTCASGKTKCNKHLNKTSLGKPQCTAITMSKKNKGNRCEYSCVEGYMTCKKHLEKFTDIELKQNLEKFKVEIHNHSDEEPISEPESYIELIDFECSHCKIEFPIELEVDSLCPTCASKKKSPSHRAPPPIKTLDECREKASSLSAEELTQNVAKNMFQQQKGYRAEAKQADPDKQVANCLFAARSANKIGNALILDSSNFITTKALVEVGYDRDHIFIPQYDKGEYEIQKTSHNKVYHESLNQNLSESDDVKYSTSWFDYTCTFTGNKDCHPEQDIYLYFSRAFPDNESIFAVTFSKREKANEEVDRVSQTKKRINSIAKENGYALTDETIYEYGNMYFIMWEVVERKK